MAISNISDPPSTRNPNLLEEAISSIEISEIELVGGAPIIENIPPDA